MLPIGIMHQGFRANPDGLAIVDGALRLTHRQLVRQVEAVASFLQKQVPELQSRIGVCAFNNWQHVVAILGVFASGHTWVPINPRYSNRDIKAICDAADVSLVFADEACLGAVGDTGVPVIVCAGSAARLASIASIGDTYAGRQPRDIGHLGDGIAAIKFTGGSSGTPKGVLQPYRAIMNYIASILTVFRFEDDERMLGVAPLTHGSSTMLLPALAHGGCNVIVDGTKMKAPAIADVMVREKVTASFMPPTLIYSLLDHIKVSGQRFPDLRNLLYGAAPMLPSRIREAQQLLGPCLGAIYGQAEAPMMISGISPRELCRDVNLESVGRPCPYNDVRIMAPDGSFLPPGEAGEIVVRGDLVMREYLSRPDLTAETIVDGWLHTGDVAFIDERGYLFIKDRIRDVIISGGFNVYPSDVEATLATHEAVEQVSVFPCPDDYWGERVEAAVVPVRDADLTDISLIAFARELLGPVRAPKAIHFVEALPTNAVGKVARREVYEMIRVMRNGR